MILERRCRSFDLTLLLIFKDTLNNEFKFTIHSILIKYSMFLVPYSFFFLFFFPLSLSFLSTKCIIFFFILLINNFLYFYITSIHIYVTSTNFFLLLIFPLKKKENNCFWDMVFRSS